MIQKFVYFLVVPAIILLITITCQDKEGEIMNGIVDVSSRITYVTDTAGAGDTIFVEGIQLENLERIIFGPTTVIANEVTYTAAGLKFLVPVLVSNGNNEVVFVFSGKERAFDMVTIVARQTISWFDPSYGQTGDTITVYGSNLYVATSVTVGDVEGTILTQPGELLTFILPEGAVTGSIKVYANSDFVSSEREFIACESSAENICLPNLILNGSGGFELGTLGVAATDGAIGPGWYAAGNTSRQYIEIMAVSELPASIANFPNLGSQVAKVELNSTFLNIELTNDWQIQMVNTVDPLDTARQFVMMGKIWSDLGGRQIKIHGGVARPGYTEMTNPTTLTLNQGWNEFETNPIQHTAGVEDNHVRVQLSYGYLINDGVTFYFDDIRLLDVGPSE